MKPLKGKISDRIRAGEIPEEAITVSRPIPYEPTADGKRRAARFEEIK